MADAKIKLEGVVKVFTVYNIFVQSALVCWVDCVNHTRGFKYVIIVVWEKIV